MSENSPSALLIRLDAIGDALALVPLLAALRERSIPVDVILREHNRDVFASHAVRSVEVAPFRLRDESRANHAAIERFGAHLREREYTHALIATEDPSGYRLAAAAGAPERIGFDNGWGKPLKTLWISRMVTTAIHRSAGLDPRAPHECAVLFELGRSLLPPGSMPSTDPARLRPLVLDAEPARDARVAFQVTDKWTRLGFPVEQVASLARAAIDAGMSMRFISSQSESAFADEFSRAAELPVERFAHLSDWKAAIAGSRALVAPDSGALHVAGMTGVPTLAIFAAQRHAQRQTARWRPWSGRSVPIALRAAEWNSASLVRALADLLRSS